MSDIVAFTGYARVGKDTAAKVLVEEYGYTKFAFADKVKEALCILNPLVESPIREPKRLLTLLDHYEGWEGLKESSYGNDARTLMQKLGTDVGRDLIDENIWVNFLGDVTGKVVVSDVRLLNEYQGVKDLGGTVVRIRREGYGPFNDHSSERMINTFVPDHTIFNGESEDAFKDQVRHFMDYIL